MEEGLDEFGTPLENERWERFCWEYLKDYNNTKAYIRAGYENSDSARANSARLIAKDNVKRRIEELKSLQKGRLKADIDFIYDWYIKVLSTDFALLESKIKVDEDGRLNYDALTDEERLLINGVKKTGSGYSIEFLSKQDALKELARHFGFYAEDHKRNVDMTSKGDKITEIKVVYDDEEDETETEGH